MLQIAIQAVQESTAAMDEHNIAIAVASERYQTLAKIQRMLRSSQKPLRQIALESCVTCGTICMIAKGGAVKVSAAQRLAAHLGVRKVAA